MAHHPVLIIPAAVGLCLRLLQALFIALVIALALAWHAICWLLGIREEH